MRISEKSFHMSDHSLHPNSTMLRFQNVVTDSKQSLLIVFSTYQFNTTLEINELVKSFKMYEDKTIILDFSCELFSKDLYERLLLEKGLENVKIYTNGKQPDIVTFNPLINKGCKIIISPFFLKYMDYYTPEASNVRLKKKDFLLHVGKLKVERTALVGLLSYYDLLNNNYVSYMTGDRNFAPEKTQDYFNMRTPSGQRALVRSGLIKIDSDLTFDTTNFTHDISHGRKYNSDYYNNVDFVIVCESDVIRDTHFITEKTVKCIQLNKKFILLGTKGLLLYIKEESKKHLNKDISHLTDWCDTSYDEIENTWERIDTIVDVIKDHLNNKIKRKLI